MRHQNTEEHMTIRMGRIRPLTNDEREKYPGFIYVVTEQFYYSRGIFTIIIPPGTLSQTSEGWKIFKEYIYRSHQFTTGQGCSRRQANENLFHILDRGYGMGCRRFFGYVTMSILDCNWFGCGVREWHRNGLTEIPVMELNDN